LLVDNVPALTLAAAVDADAEHHLRGSNRNVSRIALKAARSSARGRRRE
jgi:hypothetical protein